MPEWPQAGWYVEPGGPQVPRWWDGSAWGPYEPAPSAPAPAVVSAGTKQLSDPWAPPGPAPRTAVVTVSPFDPAWGPPLWPVASRPGPEGTSAAIKVLVVALASVLLVSCFFAVQAIRHDGPSSPTALPQGPASAPPPSTPQPSNTLRPGHPAFALLPGPPSGFEGESPVFTSSGVGAATTGTFTLHGGRIGGDLGSGAGGATFYLDPVGAKPSTKPVFTTQGAESGGWQALALRAGKYRLRVVAGASTTWQFNLSETLTLPLVYDVQESPTGTSFNGHGHGNRETKAFRIARASGSHGSIRFDSEYAVDSPTVFILQPAGPGSAGHHAYSVSAQVGSGGLGTIQLPGPGTYRLVVRSTGVWKVTFTVMG